MVTNGGASGENGVPLKRKWTRKKVPFLPVEDRIPEAAQVSHSDKETGWEGKDLYAKKDRAERWEETVTLMRS